MKKLLLAILLVCALLINICGFAAEDVTIYEQSFDNYKGGRFETLNATAGLGSFTAMPSDKFLAKDEEDGNTYMYFTNESDSTAMSMTYKFTNKIDKGVVVFSYDIAHSGTANTVPRVRMFGGDNTELLTLFINAHKDVAKVCGAKPDFKSNVQFGATTVEYKDVSAGVPIKVMQILNFDDDYFETYVDGEFLDRVEKLPFDSIISWGVYGYNTISYFDNLSIKTLGDLNYSVKVTGAKGGNSLEITVPESVTDEALLALKSGNIVITDKDNGKVTVKDVAVTGKTITATLGKELEYDEKFTLKLDGLKDMYGRSFDETTFMSNSEVDENGKTVLRVKNVYGITADGDEVEITEGITPEIAKIKIEFNTFVSKCENGIMLNNDALKGSIDDKTVIAEIDGLLVGEKEYTLNVNGNVLSSDNTAAKAYELNFKTSAGKFEIKELKWVLESGADAKLSDVTKGTKLKLLLKAANTSTADESMYLTYSVFSGNAQKMVMLKPVTVKSGGYQEVELEHTVAENGEDVRGIILDNFTSLTALADYAVIR